MSELTQKDLERTPQEWKLMLKGRGIRAFISGILVGVGFVVVVMAVAMLV